MNFAPLLLILLYFWKNNPSWLKNVLPRLDLPSFAPLFKILGLNDKTVSFLTSEKFAAALSAVFDNDSADLKSILPALIGLLSSQSKAEEEKKADSAKRIKITNNRMPTVSLDKSIINSCYSQFY